MWYFIVLPPLTYWHPRNSTTNWSEQVVALYYIILLKWWHKDELWLDGLKINHLNTQTACLQHKNQTEGSSVYLYIAITVHNIYCCNFYSFITLFQSCSSNIPGLCYQMPICCFIWKFVFKLPYICDSIIGRYSSWLTIWRDRVTSLKKELLSQIQQQHIPFTITTAHMLYV